MPDAPALSRHRSWRRLGLAALAGLAVTAGPLVAVPASASPAGDELVISEVFARGGSAGATYRNRYVELYNPTGGAVALAGLSLQYRSATGTANPSTTVALTGSVPAGGHFLIAGASNGANGAALPSPDQTANGLNLAAAGGTLFLVEGTATLVAPPTGAAQQPASVIDLVGYGSSATFEASAAPAPTLTQSIARVDSATGDTDVNSADFAVGEMTPQSSGAGSGPTPTPTPTAPPTPTPTPTAPPTTAPTVSIAEIQGTGDASPLAGQTVTTTGVVTARYPSGGYNGYVIQTAGSGGGGARTASDALFVYSSATVGSVAIGDSVRVTGAVSEFNGLTELTPTSAAAVVRLDAPATAPTPSAVPLPRTASEREALESMLIAPTGAFTVTDTFDLNSFGSIGLASGDSPLLTPTEVARPGSSEAAAIVADNAARAITLDDGASINFLGSTANKAIPLPYLTPTAPIRVGAPVTFTRPVVLDYRNGGWAFQPTTPLTAENASSVQPATFANTREARPAAVGGDLSIASFNVLNYFPTTGDSIPGCTFYTDRDGDPVTVNGGCDARGAANADDLERQQAKIVTAINGLGAGVVSLEEIENSAKFGKPRDEALATLTAALNSALGSEQWAYVPSPSALPALADEDVIRTAFLYRTALVEPVGESTILNDTVAFSNARKPLAQEFRLIGDPSSEFVAIVNHFKSKGSGTGADADQGDGQGASNASRVKQATALVDFADRLQHEKDTDLVYLLGDFNSYSAEDPVMVITNAGYIDQGAKDGKYSYAFDGAVGSLDHVFASRAADATVTGVDTWNINSGESVALEYSRYDYNATIFYDTSAYRSSDHDPVVVGLDLPEDAVEVSALATYGAAQTVETGAAIASRGVEARASDGSLVAGAEVTFTIDGPASFASGSTSATGVTNAAGVAVAPTMTAGGSAGSVRVTATAGNASAVLPAITVVVRSATIDVSAAASTGVVGGTVTVTVTATNNGSAPVQLTVSTRYGAKRFASVAPGASVSYTAKSYLSSIPAGTATVVAVAADGSQRTVTAPYSARKAS
ncbi:MULTISPECIES: ExeM/NucH family extracellular endonuclease [unclassified Rathayibacter]|uniref:ExeM/NucH family extracellular endonuclease n=1 Tax=unclassified Rathayibacter TaxID=2609250 RepID=UPI00188AB652|nr:MULTISPECIES: ExeM/NucH family extracellular endonuclease [unclassified Rathayibacter]MBF4462835.1 ExeM/NucH family extracellular endonuclease [Rathayibacter sp. VKM Ac-2879]MBF4504249.1 ExeM/NucH family extracellular endonuclease [Rathayibacter sp. VKM Ac-2878]